MAAHLHVPDRASPHRDTLVWILALCVVALAILVAYQQRELRILATAGRRVEAVPAITLRRGMARNTVLAPAQGVGLKNPAVEHDDAEVPGFLAGMRATTGGPSASGGLARLLGSPEFFQLFELQRGAALDARFAELFRRLALSPGELAAFKRLLVEKETAALEVVAVSETQPDGPLPPGTLVASVEAARRQVDNAIRESLGDDRFAVYREYEQTLAQRGLVAQLEQRLSYSPTPLTPAQSEALVKIFAAHAPASANDDASPTSVVAGAGAPLAILDAPAARVTEPAVAAAQTVLSPAQVGALRQLQGEQLAAERAGQLIRSTLPAGDQHLGIPLQLFLQ